MLLAINYNEADVIKKEKGQIVLKLKYYAEFSNGPWLTTVKGATKQDFLVDIDKPGLSGKRVTVGQRGGISLF